MKNCPRCNSIIPDDSIFCPDCGTKVKNITKQRSNTQKTKKQNTQSTTVTEQENNNGDDKLGCVEWFILIDLIFLALGYIIERLS